MTAPPRVNALSPAAFPDLTPALLTDQPLAQAETIPAAWYTDPRFHALDTEAVLARTWQYVGHAAQVARPGQYFLATVGAEPILVVRDKEEVLRAFFNVCRHRGGPLALADGCVKALTCKYHGWTYLLDGSLRGVPQFDRVELFDRKDFGLRPLAVAEWEGLVLVHLAGAEAPPLSQALAGIAERIAPIRLAELRHALRVDYDVACNWKAYIDNYLEGYHVPHVHPELAKLYDFRRYRTELADRYILQECPLSEDENLYSDGGGTAFYYHIFPNFMLNILPGRLQTNRVEPLGPDRCRVRFDYFYADMDSARAIRLREADVAFSDDVQREDIAICEHVQRGLGSRAYDRGRFSVETEGGVWRFQRQIKEAYRSWLAAPTP